LVCQFSLHITYALCGESLNFNTILCERDKLNQFFLRQSKLFRLIYFDFEVPVCRLWVNLLTLSRWNVCQ